MPSAIINNLNKPANQQQETQHLVQQRPPGYQSIHHSPVLPSPEPPVSDSHNESGLTWEPSWSEHLSSLPTHHGLTILLLGQLLSLCITASTVFTTQLAQGEEKVSVPTTQSFLNYFILGVVYTSVTIYKQGFRGWVEIFRRRAIHYLLFAVVDVEGNYFVVKAYNYTSFLSAMLLDSWAVPCVVLLSVFFLKMRFQRLHYLGIVVGMVGMGFLIWSDVEAGRNFPGTDYVKGDLFCILGATLYAVSNVYQEFLVRQRPLYEVLGQLGMWATLVNGVQLMVLERQELGQVNWTPQVVGCIVGFDVAMFIMYSMSPVLIRLSSATFFNLSLLTSDFYGLLFGLFLFGSKINRLYPIAYVLIIVGIVVYNIYPAPEPKFRKVLDQDEEVKAQTDQHDEILQRV
ncbi:hypothetical protein B0O80DRAFT_500151 [Mortierella sp. GBAus27b]|nr:hypothetical protein BGX31_000682 [Mortierella sp. GBA43]KAI8351284.1 hypothetical protein B0O80DRAFT_500151 [Mortierella sp. GBAus27b]